MRWIIGLTFAAFIGILAAAWIVAERTHPVILDIDPAALDLTRNAELVKARQARQGQQAAPPAAAAAPAQPQHH